MSDKTFSEAKNAIWLTSRSRMNSEKRFRRYEVTSHLLLSWLSLSVIAWAVVRGSVPSTAALDIYTAILSVVVFAFSVIIFGFKFGEIAGQHRECYLRLQKLHDGQVKDEEELFRQYHEVLGAYGNHSEWDFEALVLSRTLYSNREVWGRDGKKITWSWSMLAKHALVTTVFWLGAAAAFMLGLGTYYLIYIQVP